MVQLFAKAQVITVQQKIYGGEFSPDEGMSVLQTPDRGYILFGTADYAALTKKDFLLIKVDSNGNYEWSYAYDLIDPNSPGISTDNMGTQVALVSDGGYIMVGSVVNGTYSFDEIMVIKVDSSGIAQWTKTYGDGGCVSAFCDSYEEGYAIRELSGGGFIIAGTTLPGSYRDIYMVKTDNAGNIVSGWPKTIQTSSNDESVKDLGIMSNGNYLLAGKSYNGSSSFDAFLIEVDQSGTQGWTKRYPACCSGPGPNLGDLSVDGEFNDLQMLTNDTFVVVGNTGIDLSGSLQNRPFFIKDFVGSNQSTAPIKKDTLCCKSYAVNSVTFDGRDTSYIITGNYNKGPNQYDLLVIKLNSIYKPKWDTTYNTTLNENATGNSIIRNDSNRYVILGTAKNDSSGNISNDFFFLILEDTTVKVTSGLFDLKKTLINLDIYPNPLQSNHIITIRSGQIMGEKLSFSLCDVLGREIFQTRVNNFSHHADNKYEIKIPLLPSGVYIYHLSENKIIHASGKLMVE